MVFAVKRPSSRDDRDPLTGLAGLASAREQIAHWQAEARERGDNPPIHALLLGLKRFDTVNLAYGESAGDAALVEIAARILRFAGFELEGEWIAARLSGGTFLVAANEPCSRERWEWLAQALADSISRPMGGADGNATLRLWPRVALMRALPADELDVMLDRLSETLNVAQHAHGARSLWVDGERNLAGRSAAQLEADLLAALDRDEIEILFQPQYAGLDDRLVGAEALARWQHPELGRIGAGALFAIADRADHVAHLSRHIARRALEGAATWPDHLRLSLNVTPTDMTAGSFAHSLREMLEATGFDPARLTLEIVEQALLSNLEQTADSLSRLVDIGVRIALDDFGAGFCNFRYLKFLPLHYLKLDRAMVEDIARDSRDLAVLRGIIAMAHALDLEVIAEGIEDEVQRALVVQEGCAFYQGFLRAAPMSGDDFAALAGRA